MNNSLLDNFKTDINNIREYLQYIELVNEIERNNRDSEEESLKNFIKHFRSFHIEKKRFEYRAIIISLYGILENHINIWISEHIKNIPILLKDYKLLNDNFKELHFNLSIDLISLINKQKNNPKYEDINKEDIVKKLNLLLNNPIEFNLNSEAFIPSSGNLKHQKIIESFSLLDIEAKVINANPIIKRTKITIDTLIDFRNEISHGTKIDNILTEFNEYINSLEEYGEALFRIIEEKEKEYQIKYEIEYDFEKIETIHNVINNSILLFELENNSITIGDFILVKANDKKIYKKKVLSIQINKEEQETFTTDGKEDIGVNLGKEDINLKNNQSFYIKKKQ